MCFTRMLGDHHLRLVSMVVARLFAIALLVATAAVPPAAPASAAPATAATAARASAAGATVSGIVTGAGRALANVWVTLTPVDASGIQVGDAIRVITDRSGRYEFPALPFDRVKLQARAPLSGGFVDTFWPAAYTFRAAEILDSGSRPARADIDLAIGGSVSGVVVDSASGAPVTGAQVTATIMDPASSGPSGSVEPVEGAGRFAISGLPPVPMMLFVRLPPGSSYLSPPYGRGSPREDLRFDGGGQTSGLVIRVGRGAEIRGTVRDAEGSPVSGAEVQVSGCRPACPRPKVTDDSGAYRITAIPPGSALRVVAWEGMVGARVQRLVDPASRPATGLLAQWYSGKDSEEDATLVDLQAGDVRSVDFQLIRGAFVTIEVLGSESEEPLSGVIAQLKPVDDPYERHFAQRLREDPTRMRMGPVPPGEYSLRVIPGTANPGYLAVNEFVDPAVAPKGVITLEAGDRVDATVVLPVGSAPPVGDETPADGQTAASLARASDGSGGLDGFGGSDGSIGSEGSGAPDGSGGSAAFARPGESGEWPGLEAGFLATATEAAATD